MAAIRTMGLAALALAFTADVYYALTSSNFFEVEVYLSGGAVCCFGAVIVLLGMPSRSTVVSLPVKVSRG